MKKNEVQNLEKIQSEREIKPRCLGAWSRFSFNQLS